MRKIYILGILILVSGVRAPKVTSEEILGSWRWTGVTMDFNEDGTYNAHGDYKVQGYDFGRFHLDGSLLTFSTPEESNVCRGTIGTYIIEFTDEGKLRFTLYEDECLSREIIDNSEWSPISP